MVFCRTRLVSWSHERRRPVRDLPSVVRTRTLPEGISLANRWDTGIEGGHTVDVCLEGHILMECWQLPSGPAEHCP